MYSNVAEEEYNENTGASPSNALSNAVLTL